MTAKELRFFECERLEARISPRQCLFNQAKAATLQEHFRSLGLLRPCLKCEIGRRIQAYLPEKTITVMCGCMKKVFNKW
jgi:hypothetical protein